MHIIHWNEPDVFSGTDPDTLARAHPAWGRDMEAFGPWTFHCLPNAPNPGGVWRAREPVGSEPVWITGRCTSSMDAARLLIGRGWMEPFSSVLVPRQTAGRGRRSRSWTSPAGNIYATWYWPLGAGDGPGRHYLGVASLLAGDILAGFLRAKGFDVCIKWPNDIIQDNRKLCGILVESRQGQVLVGIGINLVSAPESEVRKEDFALPAAALDPGGTTFSPLAFWTGLVTFGKKRFREVTGSMAPQRFVTDLEDRLAWIGEKIWVRREGRMPFKALLAGIAPDGGLKIRNGRRSETIYTGTIRPL